jgi:hypothetical protein
MPIVKYRTIDGDGLEALERGVKLKPDLLVAHLVPRVNSRVIHSFVPPRSRPTTSTIGGAALGANA